ncbi:YvcK family protein [Staphylococcus pragensis]|uniref:Gluconeogenesis factor n=1 Tax=Staphylococcus pragensis TaxID=1611836 RepID=A0A4Z1BXG8_9STAP|nr:YvcK family protein [Staphylococcus pragensis]RTX90639.1 YvcK family protein [Staphylococcus carnosus]TGN28212.1 YvcK family protein [Staphylococcus pragensis]GGG89209.1 gluconeogenesis factor [Staphylococcus pragensis]
MKQLKVVLIGGGTGLSVLARGLREYPIDITAIVTVADDGGSTGKIRNEMDIPAPGDIRNVIAALSDVEPILEELFQYRFEEHQIEGHSLGNLLLAALTNIKNDFGHAVKELSKILNIKGKVIPSTNTNVMLNAILEDGEIVKGESKIPQKNKRIERVYLEPSNVEPMEEAIDALTEADLIVLGPGSLYTSVISNLCVKGMSDAILSSKAPKLYISNIMTQPGETNNYDVLDHINAIHDHAGKQFIDYVICSDEKYDEDILKHYKNRNAQPVVMNEDDLTKNNIKIITSSHLVEVYDQYLVRHNNKELAKLIYDLALELTSTIQFKPKK